MKPYAYGTAGCANQQTELLKSVSSVDEVTNNDMQTAACRNRIISYIMF
jgi:hypothetical protein